MPISRVRAARLILRLRLVRLFNQLTSGFQRFRRQPVSGKRTATPGKSKLGWFVGGIVALSMIFSFTNIARQAMANMQQRLGSTTVTVAKSGVDAGPSQGWLGAQLGNLSKEEAQALARGEARGAKVTGTVAASPAAKVGLERDDIIIGLDQHDIASARDLIRMVASKAPGTSVELSVLRNGKELKVRVSLAARPTGAVRQQKRVALPAAPGYALPREVLQGSLLEACVLLLATLLMSLASREIAQPDWDVEWLVTFPVPLTTLLGVRILERTLVNPTSSFLSV